MRFRSTFVPAALSILASLTFNTSLQAEPQVPDAANNGPQASTILRAPRSLKDLDQWRKQLRTRSHFETNVLPRDSSVPIGIMETFAGTVPFQQPATALNASLGNIVGMAQDANGNLFLSTSDFRSVLKIDTSGNVTVYAGQPLPSGPVQASGDGGPATAATLDTPQGLAVDGSGNLYIADAGSHTIRMVSAGSGVITTIAGATGQTGTSPDGTPALSALFSGPGSITIDPSGNLFLVDNSLVREINHSTGLLSTVAGSTALPTCQQLSASQTCPANSLEIGPDTYLNTIAISNGYLYISADYYYLGSIPYDTDYHQGAILAVQLSTGTMHLVAGGALQGASSTNNAIGAVIYPLSVAVDDSGNVDFLEGANPYLYDDNGATILQVPVNGTTLTTIAGTGDAVPAGDGGPATAADIVFTTDMIIGNTGNILLNDYSSVRSIDSAGTITTIAGNETSNYFGDGAPALAAGLGTPQDAILDTHGNLYIADSGNGVVRKVDAVTGVITTIAGTGGLASYPGSTVATSLPGDGGPATGTPLGAPTCLALDNSGNLYINNYYQGIRSVNLATGVISTLNNTVAGNGTMAFDGLHTLYAISGEMVDAVNIKTGAVTHIAGNGYDSVVLEGGLGDGGPAIEASMFPVGLALDNNGNLYISDGLENDVRIVKLSTGVINQYAGFYPSETGSEPIGFGYSGDGGPASAAVFGRVYGIHNDGAGHLLIADSGNNVIRQIDLSTSIITTVAGDGTAGFGGDGGSQLAAMMNGASSASADAMGNLYIADLNDDRIRKVTLNRSQLSATLGTSSTNVPMGTNITLTATLTGAVANEPPTGTVTFYDGLVAIGFATPTAGDAGSYLAILKTSTLSAGAHSITAQFGGDADYSPIRTAVASIKVTELLTASLVASATSVTTGTSVTLTSTFSGAQSGIAPTGSVTFHDGTNSIGTGTLSAASTAGDYIATLTNNTLAAGTHSITAQYAGDANYAPVITSAVVLTVTAPIPPSYTIAAKPSSLSIAQGSTGTTVLTVTPAGGFNHAVSFSCGSALPTGVRCSFSPATVTPSGTAAASTTLTITTTGTGSALFKPTAQPATRWWLPTGATSLACLLMIGIPRVRRRGIWLAVLVAALAAGANGCGSGGSASGGGSNSSVTPPGTYSIQLTTNSGSGSSSESQPLTISLTVTE